MTTRARILIVDDHRLFREGLRALLEDRDSFRVVGEAANGRDALKLSAELEPDLVLLDTEMPGISSKEFLRRLHLTEGKPRVVLLATMAGAEKISEALNLGARGVVMKESATSSLFDCLKAVLAGKYWSGREEASDLEHLLDKARKLLEPQPSASDFGLTRRETQLLSEIVTGKSNRELAVKFAISEQTVKHHVTHIFDKMGVYNRLELALLAIHRGLVRRSDASSALPEK